MALLVRHSYIDSVHGRHSADAIVECLPSTLGLFLRHTVPLSVFEVFFHSHEVLGRQPNLFVLDEVKNAPKNHQNVVPNQSAVLVRHPSIMIRCRASTD
ncbi:MAG: hypothetical protein JWN63_907 [Candidatus Acidoferrum typicum]|nr:hypothetical protein [Candidatus Acidoferrum typicum]